MKDHHGMTDMTDAELMKLLPSLTKEQAKIIIAWAKNYNKQEQAANEDVKLVLELINRALGLHVPIKAVPPKWANNAPVLTGFIDETFPKSTKIVRMALCNSVIHLIIDDLKEKNVRITFGTIWINLVATRIAEVFDHAYPDYRKAGLTGLIVKAMGGVADGSQG